MALNEHQNQDIFYLSTKIIVKITKNKTPKIILNKRILILPIQKLPDTNNGMQPFYLPVEGSLQKINGIGLGIQI